MQKSFLENLGRSKGYFHVAWNAKRVYQILLLSMLLGQQSQKSTLHTKRSSYVPGTKNVCQTPIVDSSKIILLLLHIKLGLMKNFVKAMNKSGEGFKHLQNLFPTISFAKLNEGIFIGPDFKKVITDSLFIGKLDELERNAWISFVEVFPREHQIIQLQDYNFRFIKKLPTFGM